MITSILLILLADVFSLLVSKMISGSGSADEFTDAVTWFFTQMKGLDYFMPVHETISIFRWGILIFASIFFIKISILFYNKIRGISGST